MAIARKDDGSKRLPSKRSLDTEASKEQRKNSRQEEGSSSQPPKRRAIAKVQAKQPPKPRRAPARGIVIRENGEEQTKTKKQTTQGKGKKVIVDESGLDSPSYEIVQNDISKDDEGEPIEEQEWVGRFINEKAFRAYTKIVISKAYIPEKPLHISALSKKFPDLLNALRNQQKWGPILKGHGKANLTWVRELYANWRHTHGNVVRVRKVDIDISAEALNNFLNVPNVSMDRYKDFIRYLDYSQLRLTLCPGREDTKWTSTPENEHFSLAMEFMCTLARVTLNWVCNRLMPCTHKTNVPQQRVFLIYALMMGIELNLGEIMHQQMQRTRNNFKWQLFYANTLTAYMQYLNVPEYKDDEIERAPKAYDITCVQDSNRDRTSRFTSTQWYRQVLNENEKMREVQERQAEQINAIQEVQARHETMLKNNTFMLQLLCRHFKIDTSAADPSSSTPATAPQSMTSALPTASISQIDCSAPSRVQGSICERVNAPVGSTIMSEGLLIDALDGSTTHSVVASTFFPVITSGNSILHVPVVDVAATHTATEGATTDLIIPTTIAEPKSTALEK